jgi:nucleolar protein 15
MNNYLMYGHILKCKFVPNEQLHPDIWKGANRRFKKTPWNKIEKKRLESGKPREKWTKSIEQEQRRRVAKLEKLKQLGYEFEIPELKSVDEVPVQGKDKPALETAETEKPKAIEAPAQDAEKPADATPKSTGKAKKAKKVELEPVEVKSKNEADAEATASPAVKKAKKAEKAKRKSKA